MTNKTTKQQSLERLKILKDMLERHDEIFPEVEFDMDTWADTTNETPKDKQNKHCGTAACALGSAASYEPFRRRGLKLTDEPFPTPKFNLLYGYEAGAEFFGISKGSSEMLFNPVYYPDEYNVKVEDVIERVNFVINNHGTLWSLWNEDWKCDPKSIGSYV